MKQNQVGRSTGRRTPASDISTVAGQILATVERIEKRLSVLIPELPADARAAVLARETAKARGFHTPATFAACIGRASRWVSDRCAAKTIRTLPGGKPWRIPLAEEGRWNGGAK